MATKTWQSYKTAERMLAKYLKAEGLKFELPVTEKVILGFIHWLAFKRGLKAGSISGYLSGIKKLHIMKGAEEPKIRTELVNTRRKEEHGRSSQVVGTELGKAAGNT